MCDFAKPDRLIGACRLLVAVWTLVGSFLAVLAAGFAGAGPAAALGRALMAILATAALLLAVEVTIAWSLRCPSCDGWVLLEAFRPLHPAARAGPGGLGGHYAPIVADVLRRRRFTCMYCGHTCRVAKRAARDVRPST